MSPPKERADGCVVKDKRRVPELSSTVTVVTIQAF